MTGRAATGPLAALVALALAACAPHAATLAGAPAPPPAPDWAFQASDVPVDPAFRFGKLANGMRYVIRANGLPKGTALVRMQVEAGSLDERDDERGYAHFVEHMAFNGSTHVPEGEMVKLLERDGLAFGADTNARTSYQRTTYMLDLPRADPALVDTALTLMRETVSELTFAPAAVDRERGVVLAEMRDSNTFALHSYQDELAFVAPGSRLAARLPIGTQASLESASAERLRAFWQRQYVPGRVTLVVIGDVDVGAVEQGIAAHFATWPAAPAQPPSRAGPFSAAPRPEADVYIDPALSEHVSVVREGPWRDEPDSLAQRRENLLRQIGYGVINRRLLSRSREADAPFRRAVLSSDELYKEGRASELAIDTVDGKWRRGLMSAAGEYRRALAFGFTPREIAEQVATMRNASLVAAQGQDTRSNAQLVGAVMALLEDERVPDTPRNSLARLDAFTPQITPEAVLGALRRDLVELDAPLLRFEGRTPPLDGARGLRAAWDEAMRQPPVRAERPDAGAFAYTDFGAPAAVVEDRREALLGIREVRFSNGVRLNLKRTELEADRVLVRLSLDGGNLIAGKDNPLATRMVSVLAQGGLGKHSKDELDSLLAGHTVSANFSAGEEAFTVTAATTPADLELELDLLSAQIVDPGYRKEGEVLFRQSANNMFAALRATPSSALSADLGALLSDGDPRFSLGKVEDWRALSFARLRNDLSDRFAHGAIEIGIVGDIDEEATIALVARTLGALPAREADFRPYGAERTRSFTALRTRHVLHHSGAMDQALLVLVWPTRDGEDPVETLELALLERVVRITLTETLREALGKAYSPSAASNPSRVWHGYGTFSIMASLDVGELDTSRAAIAASLAALAAKPIDEDLMRRARAPLLEDLDHALLTNAGWLGPVERAQTRPDRIERLTRARQRVEAITPERLRQLAARYLAARDAVEIDVLPDGVDEPGS